MAEDAKASNRPPPRGRSRRSWGALILGLALGLVVAAVLSALLPPHLPADGAQGPFTPIVIVLVCVASYVAAIFHMVPNCRRRSSFRSLTGTSGGGSQEHSLTEALAAVGRAREGRPEAATELKEAIATASRSGARDLMPTLPQLESQWQAA